MRSNAVHQAVAPAINKGQAQVPIRWAQPLPVTKKVAPSQPGDKLLCVRYRQNPQRGERIVTMQLEVGRAPLRPTAPAQQARPLSG